MNNLRESLGVYGARVEGVKDVVASYCRQEDQDQRPHTAITRTARRGMPGWNIRFSF